MMNGNEINKNRQAILKYWREHADAINHTESDRKCKRCCGSGMVWECQFCGKSIPADEEAEGARTCPYCSDVMVVEICTECCGDGNAASME
jgi:RecJ-like exonuclease